MDNGPERSGEARWLTIVGIGEDGLDGLGRAARDAISSAELLVGGQRHLAMVPEDGRQRLAWGVPLTDSLPRLLEWRGRPVCVLASGDPMWFGIGATLGRQVPACEMRVFPAPSAFSLAAARLGWALAETACVSLHGRPAELMVPHLHPGARLLLLSWDRRTPAAVAALLRQAGYGASRLHVLVSMGGMDEDIRSGGTDEPWGEIADLNTVAVECRADAGCRPLSTIPGLPDDAFAHDGQITKRAVRAATLAALAPLPGQHLWDIGAGSGSISIEWLRCHPRNRASAVERREDRAVRIVENAMALGVPGLRVVRCDGLAALDKLDPPDAIFIGGGLTGPELVERCWGALPSGGRLVANAVTLESEAVLLAEQSRRGGELTRIAISRAEPIGGFTGWRSAMPVTQWSIVKP